MDAMEQQLHTVVHELNDNEAASAIIITGGQADVFVRHYDVGVLVQRGEKLAAKGMVFYARPSGPAFTYPRIVGRHRKRTKTLHRRHQWPRDGRWL